MFTIIPFRFTTTAPRRKPFMAAFNNDVDYDEDIAAADAFFEFAPAHAPPPVRPVNMNIMNDMDNFTIADLNDADDIIMPPREENDPYLDRDDVVQNIIQVMDNNLVLLQTAFQAQPTNMRLAIHMNEFRSMRNAFMVHRQLEYLPEAVRDEEANEMTDLCATLQEMRRLFLSKAACGGVTEDMLDDPDPNVCIRQPLVPGLEHSGTHHVVIRRKKGGKNKTFQWSHVTHYALYGHHLHSKDNQGHWMHCPDTDDRRGVDLGHNCHVPDCINKWHINFEPWWLNAARNCCRYAGKCLGDRVHPGAIPCVFTEDTMRVLRSERFPEVPIPPGIRRNKPGPRPGAPKTAKQAAYNTERRSATSKASHQQKTEEQKREEALRRAESARRNRERKNRNARRPASDEVMEAMVMQHKVTSATMPASMKYRRGKRRARVSKAQKGLCLSCGATTASRFHPSLPEWEDFYAVEKRHDKKRPNTVCHKCFGALSSMKWRSGPVVKPSIKGGNGLFAERDYLQGELVTHYGGKLHVPGDKKMIKDGTYVRVIHVSTEGGFIDGKSGFGSNLGRYINAPMKGYKHNCRWYKFKEEEGVIPLKTNKEVKRGQEFSVSYGSKYDDRVKKFKKMF